MKCNPHVTNYDGRHYVIRFVRNNWKVLLWVQDLSGPKMKDTAVVDLPPILFSSKEEAEGVVRNTVIPYLLTRKDVSESDISGGSAICLSTS